MNAFFMLPAVLCTSTVLPVADHGLQTEVSELYGVRLCRQVNSDVRLCAVNCYTKL